MILQNAVVAIGTLGGTITMTSQGAVAGVGSTLGADDLVQSIPGLSKLPVKLRLKTIDHLASGSIRFETLFRTLTWAKQQVEEGANGVVLVQGTDTLEESAFFLDMYWPYAAPLVLTGAMRSPDEAGADGPANVLAAIQTAMHPKMRNCGAVVVMSDEIHQARFVRKQHTMSVKAFVSPVVGPLGYVQEGGVALYRPVNERAVLPVPSQFKEKVLLVETVLDEATDLYEVLPSLGYSGLVIAGVGSGHVSEHVRDRLVPVLAKMPVMMASRTGAGSTTKAVYGYKGGEIDLQSLGVVMADALCPRKARLLLSAVLWSMEGQHSAVHQVLKKYLKIYQSSGFI